MAEAQQDKWSTDVRKTALPYQVLGDGVVFLYLFSVFLQ